MRVFEDMHDAAAYMKEILWKNEMDSFGGSYSYIQKDDLRLIGDHRGRHIIIKFEYIGYKPYETPEYKWMDNEHIFMLAVRKLRREKKKKLADKLQRRFRVGHFKAKPTVDDWEIAFALVYCGASHYVMPTAEAPGEKIAVSEKSYIIKDYDTRFWSVL